MTVLSYILKVGIQLKKKLVLKSYDGASKSKRWLRVSIKIKELAPSIISYYIVQMALFNSMLCIVYKVVGFYLCGSVDQSPRSVAQGS